MSRPRPFGYNFQNVFCIKHNLSVDALAPPPVNINILINAGSNDLSVSVISCNNDCFKASYLLVLLDCIGCCWKVDQMDNDVWSCDIIVTTLLIVGWDGPKS